MRWCPALRFLLAIAGLGALLAGCGGTGTPSRPTPGGTGTPSRPTPGGSATGLPAPPATRAAELAGRLADEDLVGQVLMPYAYGASASSVSPGSVAGNRRIGGVDTPAEMIKKFRLGGLILVAFSADDPTAATNPTSNLESVRQIHSLTAGLQSAAATLPAGVPLLLGADQEYGVVTRIRAGVAQLPSAMALGAAARPELTRRAWAVAGADLAALGINVDFATDADVLGPGGSAVIGSRSFGSDPAAVAAQVDAAVRGLADGGVIAVPKHFPGHGHTTADSHATLPVLDQDAAALARDDLPPFRSAIAAGAQMIMSGHLDVRSVDPGVPASFSGKVLTGLLRQQLGFTGVVVTDALNMAPARRWPAGEAAVRAVLAGNDLLLMPPDLPAAQRGLLDALHSGRLPRQRLVEAATRVLAVKLWLAERDRPPMSRLDDADRQSPVRDSARAAVTVLRGACRGPLVSGTITVTSSGGRDQQRAWLSGALRAAGARTGPGGAVVHLVGYGDGDGDLYPAARVTVAMDAPAVLARSPSKNLLATYSSTEAAMQALADVLLGRATAPGRSPVPVPGLPATACR